MNWTISDIINLSKLTVRTITVDAESGEQVEGSGLLYCFKGKTYLITAGHCTQFWGKGKLLIQQVVKFEYGVPIFRDIVVEKKIRNVFKKEKGKDYAIFEVKNPDNGYLNERRVIIAEPYDTKHMNDRFFTFGYPLKNRDGYPLEAYYNFSNTWKLIVEPNPEQTFHHIIEGYSGSPIVSANADNTYNFFAIQKKTFDSSGSLNSVFSTFATFYKSLLVSENTKKVSETYIPQSVADNQDYIERKVQLWNSSQFYSDFSKPEFTLYDYVSERVPQVQSFRYLLIAPAQSGKSYELKHLAHLLAEEEYAVFFIEGKSITEAEIKNLPKSENIESHPTIVIIDALDESKLGVEELVKHINKYSSKYPTVKLIISCRQNYQIQDQLKSYTPLFLCDITLAEADGIIERRLEHKTEVDAVKEYIRKPIVQEFAKNLFCLQLLIERSKKHEALPSSKVELYRLFISQSQSSQDTDYDKEEGQKIKQFQQRCALLLMLTGRQNLTIGELLQIANVTNHEQLIDFIPQAIFMRNTDNTYEFVNNAIKEYLVADLLQEYRLDEVQSIACFYNTERIKPQWYNVVMLWLELRSRQHQPIEQEIVEWISMVAKELILQCDSSSIDTHTRFLLVKGILDEHKQKGTFFSAVYIENYKVLYKFGESKELISYITDELQNIKEGYSIYNILCLTPYIDYGKLKHEDEELYSRLIDALFHIVEKYGYQDNSGGCYYFMYLNSHFYNSGSYINRLYSIIRDYHNQDAVNAMAAACTRGNYTDQYAEWFLKCEPLIRTTGTTFAHRVPLYAALGKVRTFDNVCRVLKHITDPDLLRVENDADEYVQMLSSVLSTAYQYRAETIIIELVRDSFKRLFVEHPYYLSSTLSTRILAEYKSFFSLACEQGDDVFDSIERVENFGKQTPEQQEQMRKQRQLSFDEMCDYSVFSEKIKTVANTKFDDITDTSLRVVKAGFSSDSYVLNFVFSTDCLRSFNRDDLLRKIEDKAFYAEYRMSEVTNALLQKNIGIDVNPKQLQSAVDTALEHLISITQGKMKYDYQVMCFAVKLLLLGHGEIDKDVLLGLLPLFAKESIPAEGTVDDYYEPSNFTLLQYAEQKLGKETLLHSIVSWVQPPETIGEPQFMQFINYLISTDDPETLYVAYDSVMKHPNLAVVELLTEQLLNVPLLKVKLKEQIDTLSEDCKMLLLSQAIENESESSWARGELEKLFTSLNPFNQRRAIHLLLKAGSKYMLEYVNAHRDEVLAEHTGYIFTFNDPSCLDMLLSLYTHVYKTEDIMHISSNSIMVSIGNIAQQSTEWLEQAIDGVKAIHKELQMPILLEQIDMFRTLYYQRMDISPSFEEALVRVNEMVK